MAERHLSLVDQATGDILLYWSVPSGRYVEFLEGLDDLATRFGADRWEVIDLANPSHITPAQQNGVTIERARDPHSNPRMVLSGFQRRVLEYLWMHEGEAIYKRELAADLGVTFNQAENALRKLKGYGLVTVGRNVDGNGANGASSFFINKEAVLARLAKVGRGTVLDLSGYDPGDLDDVGRMFSDVEEFHVRRGQLASGELSIEEYMALESPLLLQISLQDAVMSAAGVRKGRAQTAAKSVGAKPSDMLGSLSPDRVPELLGRFS